MGIRVEDVNASAARKEEAASAVHFKTMDRLTETSRKRECFLSGGASRV